ncbi:hypothetical protein [Lysinibacillus sp. 38-6]
MAQTRVLMAIAKRLVAQTSILMAIAQVLIIVRVLQPTVEEHAENL